MYSFNSRVRYSETDEQGRLSIVSAINYLQDCSTFHGEDAGVGVAYHTARNHAWLLAAYEILIPELPVMGDRIEICSWPYKFRGPFGFRCFEIRSPEGKVYIRADSQWFLYDSKEGCPVRVMPEDIAPYASQDDRRIDMPPMHRKIAVEGTGTPADPIVVARHHLDTNHHVNNAQYIEFAREAVEAGLVKAGLSSDVVRCSRIDVQYKKMAYLGDTVYPFIQTVNGEDGSVAWFTVDLRDAAGESYAVVRVE